MAPIRLRHPKGVATIQVDFDNFTVLDLQQEIFAMTEIPPSRQDCRFHSLSSRKAAADKMLCFP